MNTRLLMTLLAVHRHGSMADAARRLNLTHGAVAQQIRTLEDTLNISLVRRAGKAVKLTEAGHRILEQAKKILEDVEALAALANADEPRGTISVGAGNTVLNGKMPDILAGLGMRYPDIRVNVVPGQSSEFYTWVEQGALDAAIALQPSYATSKTVGWHQLSEEPFEFIAARRHQGDEPHRLLKQQPFIRYHRDTWAGQQIDEYLRTNRIVPRERFELAATEAIVRIVRKDLGVAIVPSVWHQWRPNLDVVSWPLKMPPRPRRFGLIWSRSSPRQRLISALLDVAVEVYQQEDRGVGAPA